MTTSLTPLRMPRDETPDLDSVRRAYAARADKPVMPQTIAREGMIEHLMQVAFHADHVGESVIVALTVELLVIQVIDDRDDELLLDTMTWHLSDMRLGSRREHATELASDIREALHDFLDDILGDTVTFDAAQAFPFKLG